jgi:hypothetical protein
MTDTLHFSQGYIGILGAISSAGSICGALIYRRCLAELTSKRLLQLSIVLGTATTASFVLLFNEATAAVLNFCAGVSAMIALVASLTLAADYCPKRSEGFMFAALMSITNLASALSDNVGALLYQHVFSSRLAPLILVSAAFTAFAWIHPAAAAWRQAAGARHRTLIGVERRRSNRQARANSDCRRGTILYRALCFELLHTARALSASTIRPSAAPRRRDPKKLLVINDWRKPPLRQIATPGKPRLGLTVSGNRIAPPLGPRPWEVSPLDAIGECTYPPTSMGALSWPRALALRKELERLAHIADAHSVSGLFGDH